MLHILTGAACNNNCLFCMEEDRAARAAHVGGQSRQDIRAMLSSHAERDEVLFTSGEPTLNPDLLEYVSWAREEGYRVIGLITNGRMLSYPGAAGRLAARGVNRITLSIHGHTARLHDGLTRTPGSFAQSNAGLGELLSLGKTPGLTIQTSTVVNKRNLEQIEAIYSFLARRDMGPDLVVFNVMMPVGRGARHFDAMVPRYVEVARALKELTAGMTPDELRGTRLVDLPVCAGRELPAQLWGEPEPFEQFEAQGSSGLQELSPIPGEQSAPALVDQDRSYYLTSRRLKEDHQREQEGPCRSCAARSLCPGVYRRYTEAYGWDELVPIGADELPGLMAHFRSGAREKRRPRRVF